MAFYQNNVTIRGYVNFVELKQFPSGDHQYQFSIATNMGKDKQTGQNRPSEYHKVQCSSNCSKSNHGKFHNGDFVQIDGRLRAKSYQNNQGQKSVHHYVEAYDLFVLVKGQPKGEMGQQPQYQQHQQPMTPVPAPQTHGAVYAQQSYPDPNQQANGSQNPNEQPSAPNPYEAQIPF